MLLCPPRFRQRAARGRAGGLGAASRPVGGGNLLVAAEYVHADGPWTIPDNYNKGNLVANYSQGNAENERTPLLLANLAALFDAGQSVPPHSGTDGSRTRCWREMDSNFRFRARGAIEI